MNPLEKHLKDRLADATAPVSPAGQDALWAAVEGGLDGRHNRGAFWFVLGGLFSIALSIVAVWYLRAPADTDQLAPAQTIASNTFKRSAQNTSSGYSALLNEDVALPSGEAAFQTVSGERGGTTASNDLTTSMLSGVAGMQPLDTPQLDAPVVQVNTTAPNAETAPPHTPAAPVVQTVATSEVDNTADASRTPDATLAPPIAPLNSTNPTPQTPAATRSAADRTSPSPLSLLPLLQPDWTPTALGADLIATAQDVEQPAKSWAIRAYGGGTWSKVRYTGEGTSDFNVFQRPDWGWSVGAAFQLDMSPGQRLEVGLGVNEFYHRFDYELTTVGEVLVENQLIETQINGITGDTVALIYGNVLATRTEYRRVLHHNRQRTFSVPVEWQWVSTSGRFEAGLGLGAVLHLQLDAAGRTLNAEGEVVYYTGTDAPQTAVSVSPRLRPFVGVTLSPSWRLDVAVPVGLQWGRYEDWGTRTTLGGLQLGLTRRF